MKKRQNLLEDNIKLLFRNYVLSSIMGMITVSLYVLFDTIFIGRGIGSEGLTALNIAIPIYNVIYGVGMLIGTGGGALMSISRGQKDEEGVKSFFKASITLGIIMSLVFFIGGIIFLENIALILGASEESLPLVKEYLQIILLFSPFFLMVQALNSLVRNDRGYKRAMVATIAGGFTNLVLDYIFIFPLSLGMFGAALATGISAVVSVSVLLGHFINNSRLKLAVEVPKKGTVLRVLKVGAPAFIIEISSGIAIYLFNLELLKLSGDLGVAAYSIIANCAIMFASVATGIGQGIQPLLSINYGGGKLERVKIVRNMALFTGVTLGVLSLAVGLAAPEFIASLFTHDRGEILLMTVEGIKLYFIAFPLMGVTIVMSAYFQSVEKSSYSTIISLCRGIIFIALFLNLLPIFLGIQGVWLAIPTAEIATIAVIGAITVYEKITVYNKKKSLSSL